MKPLTIEELKALEVGDWVWIQINDPEYVEFKTGYAEIEDGRYYREEYVLPVTCHKTFELLRYSDYGTKWIAYKNKEMAEDNDKDSEIRKATAKEIFNLLEINERAGKIILPKGFLFTARKAYGVEVENE